MRAEVYIWSILKTIGRLEGARLAEEEELVPLSKHNPRHGVNFSKLTVGLESMSKFEKMERPTRRVGGESVDARKSLYSTPHCADLTEESLAIMK